jgi:preprotein translocase subunit SecG
MASVLLVIHLILAVSLVGLVLVQRSEGGGLGMGSGNMGGMMTARGTANLLTRMTAIVAGLFMVTSLSLVFLAGTAKEPKSIFDQQPVAEGAADPASAPAPAEPAVPVSE